MGIVYWTKERVIEGLSLFYLHKKITPLDTWNYVEATKEEAGKKLWDRKYPCQSSVLRYFKTFREAWEAVGIAVDRSWVEWNELEDWYLSEAAGILTRKQIAIDLRRSENAVHRRLYDLGIDSRKHKGWSAHRLSEVAGIPNAVIVTYMERGELPYFKGTRLKYMDPADFMIISQIDWNHPPAELEEAIRKSLMLRLCKIILRQDWRATSLYKAHSIRTTNKRWRGEWIKPIEKTVELERGDKVICTKEVRYRPHCKNRSGVIKKVYFSRNATRAGFTGRGGSARPQAEPCWMALVEFPKLKKHGNELPRVHYSLPVDYLKKADLQDINQ